MSAIEPQFKLYILRTSLNMFFLLNKFAASIELVIILANRLELIMLHEVNTDSDSTAGTVTAYKLVNVYCNYIVVTILRP